MALFAIPELAFIMGSASFCQKRVQASEILDKAKPRICRGTITEGAHGSMPARERLASASGTRLPQVPGFAPESPTTKTFQRSNALTFQRFTNPFE